MSTEPASTEVAAHADEPIVRVRHPWRWVAVVVIALYVAEGISFAATNDALRWDLVGGYLFEESILRGLWMTVKLTVVAMLVGLVLGTVLAVMRLSDNPVLRGVAGGYVWLFRGTPILVQLLFWFFLGTVLPEIGLGIPFGPDLVSGETSEVITPFMAAILGLGLNEAAYMAEIVRAGIGSVDKGQTEAAEALGMSPVTTYRRVVLPQAARLIVPPAANQTISMLKLTSLVLVIGLAELTTTAQLIYGRNFQQIPLLIVASIWYLDADHRADHRPEPARATAGPQRRHRPAPVATPGRDHEGSTRMSEQIPMVEAVGVRKVYGQQRGAQEHRPARRSGRGGLAARPVRVGEEHAAALHQPPRVDRRRRDQRQRQPGRLPAGPRQEVRAAPQGDRGGPARTSAWCSSASTCSRTAPRWRT